MVTSWFGRLTGVSDCGLEPHNISSSSSVFNRIPLQSSTRCYWSWKILITPPIGLIYARMRPVFSPSNARKQLQKPSVGLIPIPSPSRLPSLPLPDTFTTQMSVNQIERRAGCVVNLLETGKALTIPGRSISNGVSLIFSEDRPTTR